MRRSVLPLLAVAGLATVPVSSAVAGSPSRGPQATELTVVAKTKRKSRCDRNYSGRCLKPNVSDYDCAGGSGNGPYYVRGPFRVVGTDHYRLDSDRDGIACER